METKTYFASSVQAAMGVARRELGPDAMLVTSRPAPEDARVFGRLEVTFAWEPGAAEAPEASFYQSPAPEKPLIAVDSGARRGDGGLEDIRLEISALRAAIGRQTGNRPGVAAGVEVAVPGIDGEACQRLCETGFESEMARQIVAAAAKAAGETGDGILRELKARIPAAEFAPLRPDESRTLAFLGAPGRGKTSSLVKIAVRYGLANRIPTRIYTAGAHGVGATEQMARYAAILGVPYQTFETFESLNLALHGDRWKGLVLIDTPGGATGDRQEMDGMAKFFARRGDIEKHLVIRAEARSADMRYMVTKFTPVQPTRLLFTGVDEVRGLGAAAETMIRSGIAATFFGTGPQIPEDLEEVSVAKLARSLWTPNRLAARAA
jgi:flagellar biosynthesis GTPase FlhF